MSDHTALIARLCEASEGSAELSREWWEWITGSPHEVMPDGMIANRDRGTCVACLTTDLSAAWEEAEKKGKLVNCKTSWRGGGLRVYRIDMGRVTATGLNFACTLCAAILAAEG